MGAYLNKADRPKYAFKILRKGQISARGNLQWRKGEWNSVTGGLEPCYNGLHLCLSALPNWVTWGDTFSNDGEVWVAEIDTSQSVISHGPLYEHKFVAKRARILKKVRITKKLVFEFIKACSPIPDYESNLKYWAGESAYILVRDLPYIVERKKAYQFGEWLMRKTAPELFEES